MWVSWSIQHRWDKVTCGSAIFRRALKKGERDMAKINGGHITKGEQKVLNQQENAVSRQIGR